MVLVLRKLGKRSMSKLELIIEGGRMKRTELNEKVNVLVAELERKKNEKREK